MVEYDQVVKQMWGLILLFKKQNFFMLSDFNVFVKDQLVNLSRSLNSFNSLAETDKNIVIIVSSDLLRAIFC